MLALRAMFTFTKTDYSTYMLSDIEREYSLEQHRSVTS